MNKVIKCQVMYKTEQNYKIINIKYIVHSKNFNNEKLFVIKNFQYIINNTLQYT